jgi:SAM-dependent methyltransferase
LTRLELGVGMKPLFTDSLHHDRIMHSSHVHIAHDLEKLPWPFGQFDEIWAIDVMEHLRLDPQKWLDECHRHLTSGGRLEIRVPAWDNPLSYRDPTHRRVFHEESFYYWDPRTDLYADFGRYYFAESALWWNVQEVRREANDIRVSLVKLGS